MNYWTLDIASWLLLAFFLSLPLLGYVFMVIDVRAYLRALKGALMIVSQAPVYVMPDWARRQEVPVYFESLGLRPPCTETDVKEAYRRIAEQVHPDRGGDPQHFHALRMHFDLALEHVRRKD